MLTLPQSMVPVLYESRQVCKFGCVVLIVNISLWISGHAALGCPLIHRRFPQSAASSGSTGLG